VADGNKTWRAQPGATKVRSDATALRIHADTDKALVMTYLSQLVADGYAQSTMLDDGNIQLDFSSGETFLLAEQVVIRLT
jgi:hypothetical protein